MINIAETLGRTTRDFIQDTKKEAEDISQLYRFVLAVGDKPYSLNFYHPKSTALQNFLNEKRNSGKIPL